MNYNIFVKKLMLSLKETNTLGWQYMPSLFMAHHQFNFRNVKFEEVLCKIPTTSVFHKEIELFFFGK